MALITYDFYKNVYGGSVVSVTDFPKYERLAELFLNRVTFGHIVCNDGVWGQIIGRTFNPLTEKELEALQYGVCNLLESQKKLQEAEDKAISGNSSSANVKSRTSGGESISYESSKTTYDEAIANDEKKTELLKNALMLYAYQSVFSVNPFYAGSR